jgi:hypothetical protein
MADNGLQILFFMDFCAGNSGMSIPGYGAML